ncbi:PQQ-binding-like beta-propeller repeat protein [Tuwongella immobilis]|uniref:Pyrrolo-quinoline quinone repeat domain-containing protein n=1 Tax=Tuwongella immobilis TaxID=692036 RepID=A0A6C2YN83_9BACT|nr:PQQ-binding-like beta-propeller repeat protein [Tuwongella immobilis]VIP02669.1 Outer membrane protein assembly factor BamB OS=Xylella fastidiosa (strain GB514) GN=bamB PE=3 SV=1: PQQ_2 [Tuwongella immobilis]VTS02096.1 Outer membrane protein assembly factor BamB OS=Xylella fastidiosa (strain GB514) GN=bamB PE=3 SV=1: PQQ_2 [Tuwongella immobilis]
MMHRNLAGILLVGMLSVGPLQAEPWATYRGNPQRTGNTDGVAGPTKPVVRWVVKSQSHFVASPVIAQDRLLISGLGSFNVPSLQAFALNGSVPVQPLWQQSSPYLQLPTVSSPSVHSGHLFFGDGMHQTNGAFVHCLQAGAGLPIWRLSVPGDLVHLEGSPVIAGDTLFLGGGAAGVLAIRWNRAMLDGAELDLAQIAAKQTERKAMLTAKYEQEKRRDPDFAQPPTDDALHQPTPKIRWQSGKNRWHVDAPLNLVDQDLFVASAFLDKEQLGERGVLCLDPATGETRWKAPLAHNPWGGVAVAGDTVIVGGSSIGYAVSQIRGAKGELTALDRSTGKERWRKDVPGGIVGCPAIGNDLAIVTATDGKVRAYSLRDGERRWMTDVKFPIFAPPAVVNDLVVVADLRGSISGLDRKSGTLLWTVHLATDPMVRAPGMVYGGPIIHGGRIYVATCNLEGPTARQPTVVVCLGNP